MIVCVGGAVTKLRKMSEGHYFDTLKYYQNRFFKCYKKITVLKYKSDLIFKGTSNILSKQETIFILSQVEHVCRKDEIEWVWLKKQALFSRLSQIGTNTANCYTFQTLWSMTHQCLTRFFLLLSGMKYTHGDENVGYVCRKDMSEGRKCNPKPKISNSCYKCMEVLAKMGARLVMAKKHWPCMKDTSKPSSKYSVLPT